MPLNGKAINRQRDMWGNMAIIEDVNDIGLRVAYAAYISDRNQPLLSFEAWKEKQTITNPATLAVLGKL